jgi:hypothetical protein
MERSVKRTTALLLNIFQKRPGRSFSLVIFTLPQNKER